MGALYGRKDLVSDLTALMLKGQEVLLYGPMGIGKTSILERVRSAVEAQARPCAFAPQTRSLSEVTAALLRAYPDTNCEARTPRQLRWDLRRAMERRPGALLLDHLKAAGTQFKGYLRSLRGLKSGVLFAADCELSRDHQRFRAMRLAYREVEVPPLSNHYLRRIFFETLAGKWLPDTLSEANVSALIKIARGRPGWIILMAELLQNPEFWKGGVVHLASLKASITIMVNKKYWVGEKSPSGEGRSSPDYKAWVLEHDDQ